MSRNFYDSWQNLKNANGKDLVGRLTFYEADTTSTKKKIYDVDGNELANPIYTTAHGLLAHQVLLDDSDYRVTFEQYIGPGNMESDMNETNWFLFKTILSKNGQLTVDDQTSSVARSKSIADLKNVDGMQHGDVRQVLGYYEPGDSGEPRYYVWRSETSFSDDGGVVIKSNKTTVGAWVMIVPGTYIDVRWYGDLPESNASATEHTSNLGQRSKAATAANWLHKDLYFACKQNTNSNMGYYVFDGSNTVSVSKDIICDNYVRFVIKSGTSGTSISCHELKKCDKYLITAEPDKSVGGYSLTADWINTSWLLGKLDAAGARVGYVIDLLNNPMSFEDTKIKVERNGINARVQFDNCEMVECYKQIKTDAIFDNMEIKTDWFSDDYNYITNLSLLNGCTVKLHNCKDADTYIDLKNKLNDPNYGDLGEQEISNKTIYGGGTIENFFGSITLSHTGATYFEIHNASATVNGITSSMTLNCVDSWLTIPSDVAVYDLSMRRGSLISASNKIQVISQLYLEGVDINAELYIPGVTNNKIISCTVNKKITSTQINLHNCMVYAVVESWVTGNSSFKFNVIGNTFASESGYHYINTQRDSTAERTLTVDGIWSNNTANYNNKHWVQVRQYGMKLSGHTYLYTDNGNPFFDAKNRLAQTFYGITIDVEVGGASDKSRVRTDIPLVMVNKSTREVYIANFKIYGFSLSSGLGGSRVKIYCYNNYEHISGGSYTNNALMFNVKYSFPSTLTNSEENFNYEFTNYALSTESDLDHKFKLGSNVGFTLNNNLDIYTHSMSVWQQDSDGLPMARKSLLFEIDQNSDQMIVEPD